MIHVAVVVFFFVYSYSHAALLDYGGVEYILPRFPVPVVVFFWFIHTYIDHGGVHFLQVSRT